MNTALTDLDEAKELLASILDANPDRTNPHEGSVDDPSTYACVYNGPDGSHCVAGEFLTQGGVPAEDLVPFEGQGVWAHGMRVALGYSESVQTLLADAQSEADRIIEDSKGVRQATWGEVASALRASGSLE